LYRCWSSPMRNPIPARAGLRVTARRGRDDPDCGDDGQRGPPLSGDVQARGVHGAPGEAIQRGTRAPPFTARTLASLNAPRCSGGCDAFARALEGGPARVVVEPRIARPRPAAAAAIRHPELVSPNENVSHSQANAQSYIGYEHSALPRKDNTNICDITSFRIATAPVHNVRSMPETTPCPVIW
jgi:hypothetical protein